MKTSAFQNKRIYSADYGGSRVFFQIKTLDELNLPNSPRFCKNKTGLCIVSGPGTRQVHHARALWMKLTTRRPITLLPWKIHSFCNSHRFATRSRTRSFRFTMHYARFFAKTLL